jgi:hypothetical protein
MSDVTEYLKSMEEDVTRPGTWTKEAAQAWVKENWRIRHDPALAKEERAENLRAHDAKFRPVRDVSTNSRGNTVIRRHRDAERYLFDFDDDFRAADWLSFDTDQDAWYFGVWVNPTQFKTLSYAEGDVTLVLCTDVAHYNAEIEEACRFYGEGFECIATNLEGFQQLLLGGQVAGAAGTIYRQDRQKFFAP